MTPAVTRRPFKYKFFKSKERGIRIRKEEDDEEREVLREANERANPFTSSPLQSDVSFPNELSAIKAPPLAPTTTTMTGRRKATVCN